MDLGLNEFQRKIQQTAREFLAKECPKSVIRQLEADETGHSPEIWRRMADLGWMGLIVPEEYGGLGGSLLDLAVIGEEMGRAAFMTPFLPTLAWGALPVIRYGSESQREEILPAVANGSVLMTAAIVEPSARYTADGINLAARGDASGYRLSGQKLFVEYPHVSRYILTAARTTPGTGSEGISLFLVDSRSPGLGFTPLKTTGGDRQFGIAFNEVPVTLESVLGPPGGAWPLIEQLCQAVAALQCAYMVGGAQQALEMTVEHAKNRVQFGQPLGKFQAVQHHCANMAMLTEGARLITYEALWRLSSGLPAVQEVAMAKAFTNEATREVVWLAHQVHGGIGIMEEYDLHFYFRQQKGMELKLGISRDHLEKVAAELLD